MCSHVITRQGTFYETQKSRFIITEFQLQEVSIYTYVRDEYMGGKKVSPMTKVNHRIHPKVLQRRNSVTCMLIIKLIDYVLIGYARSTCSYQMKHSSTVDCDIWAFILPILDSPQILDDSKSMHSGFSTGFWLFCERCWRFNCFHRTCNMISGFCPKSFRSGDIAWKLIMSKRHFGLQTHS